MSLIFACNVRPGHDKSEWAAATTREIHATVPGWGRGALLTLVCWGDPVCPKEVKGQWSG